MALLSLDYCVIVTSLVIFFLSDNIRRNKMNYLIRKTALKSLPTYHFLILLLNLSPSSVIKTQKKKIQMEN